MMKSPDTNKFLKDGFKEKRINQNLGTKLFQDKSQFKFQ